MVFVKKNKKVSVFFCANILFNLKLSTNIALSFEKSEKKHSSLAQLVRASDC